jgi:hypothetical protein
MKMKHILAILSAVALFLSIAAATAQTGVQVETGSAAMFVDQSGQKAAADFTWVKVPFYSSPSDAQGYVNTVSLRADAFIPDSSLGWHLYGAGADFVPTKWLNKFGGRFLVPTDSLRFELNGTVGAYQPTVGSIRVAGIVGGTFSWALNSAGTVVWNAASCDYMPGVPSVAWGCSSGLTFGPFGGANVQSKKAGNLRKAAHNVKTIMR